jgi:anti-sigma factor RsiW
MKTEMTCKTCRTYLPDLLLDEEFAASRPEVAIHLAACADCGTELNELRATFALLDEYTAPEPSPYFDSRLHARLREAQAAEPESLWERVKSFVSFSTGRSFQPALAGALVLVLALGGGGTFLGVHGLHNASVAAAPSATVNDLKVLDNNDQAEQQMGQLLDQSGSEDGDVSPTT